jgi:hypothetical protein
MSEDARISARKFRADIFLSGEFMKFQKITALFIFALVGIAIAGKQTPIEINPTLNQFDSIKVTDTHSLFLRNVTIADSIKNRPLGVTRTGRKTNAPLICKPQLDTAIILSLNEFLKNKHMAAQSDSSADFLMDLSVLNAKLTEVSKGLTQTMSAQLTIEVKLVNLTDTSIKKTLVIESGNSMETLDTTKKAAQIFRGAIEAFIQELVKSIPD